MEFNSGLVAKAAVTQGPIEPYPYVISTNTTIAASGDLTIMPGVVVKFHDACYSFYSTFWGANLIVEGWLDATGDVEAPVTFTSWLDDTVQGDTNGDADATTPAADDWAYIKFTGQPGSTLDQCIITYGGYEYSPANSWAVWSENSAPLICECYITHCDAGVYFNRGYDDGEGIVYPTLSNCTLVYNTTALRVSGDGTIPGLPTISGNTIESSTSFPIVHNDTAFFRLDGVGILDERGTSRQQCDAGLLELPSLTTGVGEDSPIAFALSQNSPNPFNPVTTITLSLPEDTAGRLCVYNLSGQMVAELLNGRYTAGLHTVVWDGRNSQGAPVGSGVYLYRFTSPQYTSVKKMTLIR